jgi:DNA primase catalytic core
MAPDPSAAHEREQRRLASVLLSGTPAGTPPAPTGATVERRHAKHPRLRPGGPPRADLIAMHAAAHRLFLTQLPGSWAPAYLTGRGFDHTVQQHWQIGYAPPAWRVLTGHLHALGYTNDAILASGLGRRGPSGKPYDTFRDRIMLAIRDRNGTIAGFIGRRADGAVGPKYLNSPHTPIFHKSDLLFGLAETRHALATGARPVIVEGPLDAIAITTASPRHHAALAPCGTTLTTAHLQAIGQVADLTTTGVLLALDGDTAGRGAAVRDWDILAQVTGPLGAILLPENLDPADLMGCQGPTAVREALQTEVPLADLVIDTRMQRCGGSLEFTEQRWAALQAAATIIATLPPQQISRQVIRVATALDLEPRLVTNAVTSAISPDTPGPFDEAAADFPLPPLRAPGDARPPTARSPARLSH